MYSSCRPDPAVSAVRGPLPRTSKPGDSDGERRLSLNRRRTASLRLSCISENQKENTPSSDDEGSSSSVFAQPIKIKAPLLEPIRFSTSRHSIRKSQSSGDESTMSTLQLDSSEVERALKKETQSCQCHLPTFSSNGPTNSQEGAEHEKSYDASVYMSNVSKTRHLKWQMVQLQLSAPKPANIKEDKHAASGTGFDGPPSPTSEPSPRHLSPVSSSPLSGPLFFERCPSCASHKTKSDASSSTDREKSCPWKKNQRQPAVSDSSNPGSSSPPWPVNFPGVQSNYEIKRIAVQTAEQAEQYDELVPCEAKEFRLNSCPELHRRSTSVIPPLTYRFSSDKPSRLESPNYSGIGTSRLQLRHRLPSMVSRRFHSFRNKLHRRKSSSTYSTRPEFPPPPDGKERRIRSRNSNEILPSSSEETPVFNTPETNTSPMQAAIRNTNILAASGLLIATAELDRLSRLSQGGSSPKTRSGSSPDPIQPSSDNNSPQSGSESSVVNTRIPINSPSSLAPNLASLSPKSRPSLKTGRRTRSRLSEVTTPDDGDTLTPLDDGSAASTDGYFPTDESVNRTAKFVSVHHYHNKPPQVVSTSRSCSSDVKLGEHDLLVSTPSAVRHDDSPSRAAVTPQVVLSEPALSRLTSERHYEQTVRGRASPTDAMDPVGFTQE